MSKATDCRYYSHLAEGCGKGLSGTSCERNGCHAYYPISESDLRISVAKLREVLENHGNHHVLGYLITHTLDEFIEIIKSEL